jgi:hypothetical protein
MNNSAMDLEIVKHVYLNEANFQYSLAQYRIFLLAISRPSEDSSSFERFNRNEWLNKIHKISAEQLSEIFDMKLKNCHKELEKAVEVFVEKNINVKSIENGELQYISACSMASYNDGVLSLKFSQELIQYL